MYNSLNCPQVMGLVLAGLFTALGLEASEYWRSPATEKQQATLDRGKEADRVSSQTLSTQTTAPEENEKVERLNLGPRQASVSIQEEMVGVGVHRYVVHVPPGKTLTLKNVEGTIPRILSPDGELLSQPWDTTEEGRSQWIGEPIASGDYIIEVVSHDAQLQYSLSVEITPLQEYAQILSR